MGVYHILQASFAAGEISEEVANRTDLDKYQSALLKARNVTVKPYGGITKRQGTLFVGRAKYADKKCRLVEFPESANSSYMLEVGDKYIRVWYGDEYIGKEIATPFAESELEILRFNQSADTMYICSGNHPVQVLKRNGSYWTIRDINITEPYFDVSNGVAIDGTEATITPSATTGSITLTASKATFPAAISGAHVQIQQEIAGQTKSLTVASGKTAECEALYCGKSWKILSHGKWGGTITIYKSEDGTSWKEYRKYVGKYADGTGDLNVSETGTFDEETYIKMSITANGGTCECDLSVYGYTHTGIVKITERTSDTQVKATVIKKLGSTEATKDFAFSVWNDAFGYPICSCFFQDRLCFAGNRYYPHALWMSRSGDYYNFGVEKANGTVTDDSAIMASLISRRMYKINHLVAGQDLIILTNGNEWIVSGDNVVTPANVNPKMQTTRGSNECEPLFIGNRIIYVQRRGGTVRDMGYTYESDNYVGDDLTQLAKHLVNDYELVDAAYCQEPYSIVHFVRNDGVIIMLTYIREQNVYAWAQAAFAEGKALSMCSVPSGEEDALYIVMRRSVDGKKETYIEKISAFCDSTDIMDYVTVDCARRFEFSKPTTAIAGLEHLVGETVQVLADGRRLPDCVVSSDGSIALAGAAESVVVGLGVEMMVELPNVEAGTNGGTMQGRKKDIKEATLRLKNSLGGLIGQDAERMDMIHYDEFFEVTAYPLFTGDKRCSVPVNFNNDGRIVIVHNEPFPFTLNSIVRVVQFGG